MREIGSFYADEIALIEHDLIGESDIADMRPGDLQLYLMGVHAMAQKVIERIRRKDGD